MGLKASRAWSCVAGAVLVALLAAVGSAQSPPVRAALSAWNDSLIPDTPSLNPDLVAPRALGDAAALWTAMALLRTGTSADRQGDLMHALSLARATASAHGEWPWAFYVAARAYAALALTNMLPTSPNEEIPDGATYDVGTWRSLREALRIDPDFPEARRFLLELLVAGGDRLLRDDQIAMLRTEVSRADPDPDALLVWGRWQRTLRNYDSALATFNRAASLGGDRSRLALERARTLRALHDSTGAVAAYWDGLAHLTPAGRALYRTDIAWIVDADSLAAFDAVPDSALARWMHAFWAERGAASAISGDARLAEHLRRWAFAYAHYRVRSPWRRVVYDRVDMFFDNDNCVHLDVSLYRTIWQLPPSTDADIREREWLLDQRGIMYLRHGEPLQRVGRSDVFNGREDFSGGIAATEPDTSPVWSPWARGQQVRAFIVGPGAEGLVPYHMPVTYSESWLYYIGGEYRLLHFRDSYAIGMYGATTLSSVLPYSPMAWLARVGTLPEYTAAAQRVATSLRTHEHTGVFNPPSCWDQVRLADARSRSDADSASHNDSDTPRLLEHPWNAVIHVYGLGDSASRNGMALVTFALGGAGLKPDPLADGRELYRIHFHVTAFNFVTDTSVTLDTVRQFVSARFLAAGDQLGSLLELPLKRGEWEVAATAVQESDSSGAYALDRRVDIAGGNVLSVSDIVLGGEGSLNWRAPDGASFPINTVTRWDSGGTMELYFEVHGLPSATPYKTTIGLKPLDPKTHRSVSVSSTDRSSGIDSPVRRSVALGQLAPGDYRLSIAVTADGTQSTASGIVTVVKHP